MPRQVFDIDAPDSHNPPKLTFDPEWLAISRAMHPYLSVSQRQVPLPSAKALKIRIGNAAAWVKEHIGEDKEIASVQTFSMTSPKSTPGLAGKNYPQRESVHCTGASAARHRLSLCSFAPALVYTNPQTLAFCEMLGIKNKVNPQDSVNDSQAPV